jgi:hypothetical protein
VIFDDLYTRDTRRGILAGHAAVEFVRDTAQEKGVQVAVAAPAWNAPMQKLLDKYFGPAALTVHLYGGAVVSSAKRQESEVA